jgi:hypothetical protein
MLLVVIDTLVNPGKRQRILKRYAHNTSRHNLGLIRLGQLRIPHQTIHNLPNKPINRPQQELNRLVNDGVVDQHDIGSRVLLYHEFVLFQGEGFVLALLGGL